MSAGRFLVSARHFSGVRRFALPEVVRGNTSRPYRLNNQLTYTCVSINQSWRYDHSISRRYFASTAPQPDPKVDFASSTQEGNETPGVDDGSAEREKHLTEQITKLKEDNSSILDKYKRSLAETENLRQRLTRQIDDAKQFGIQSFVKDLLEVSDLLSRAIASTPQEALKNQPLKDLYEGLKLTDAQLMKVFKNHGLERYDPHGEQFDPNLHEAVFQVPIPGKAPNTIMEVSQAGFKLKNRVIRPAKVGVVRAP